MSKMHILGKTNDGNYKAVIHFPLPVEQNSVENSLLDCVLAGGDVKTSVMTEGTKPWEISADENTKVKSGEVIEIVDNILADSGGFTEESLHKLADKSIAARKAELQRKYRRYGYTLEDK